MRPHFAEWRRDWRRWSKAERAAAVLLLIATLLLAIIFPALSLSQV
jgi:hypothetical protein